VVRGSEENEHHDTNDACSALEGLLEGGPMWVKEVLDAMVDAGFSKDQAKRAKAKLRVRSEKFGRPGEADTGWKWVLPREQPPRREHEGSEESGSPDPAPLAPLARSSDDQELTEWRAPLRHEGTE
jgi:hypothetical protein